MKKQEFYKFIEDKKALIIGDYMVLEYISATGHTCFGCFRFLQDEDLFYIAERPDFAVRTEDAKKRCVKWAKSLI